MSKLSIFLIFIPFFSHIIYADNSIENDFENRINIFINQGFGFNYDNEISDYNIFLKKNNDPINVIEIKMSTYKYIKLEYDSIIVTYWTDYSKIILYEIESKDNINYLYGIKQGLTKYELENIIGNINFNMFGEMNGIWLHGENNHSVMIIFEGENIEKIIWYYTNHWFDCGCFSEAHEYLVE